MCILMCKFMLWLHRHDETVVEEVESRLPELDQDGDENADDTTVKKKKKKKKKNKQT